ncbi:MAG: GAF domain-containing protein [Bradyrhizobium sp.]
MAKRRTAPVASPRKRVSVSDLEQKLQRRNEELNEARDQQAATAEILKVINARPGDLTPVFDVILEKAHSLCDVPCGSLQLFNQDHTRAVAVRGMTEAFEKFLRQGYRLDRSQPVQSVRPFQIDDLAKVPRDGSAPRVAFEMGGLRTMLSVPLVRDGIAFGRIVAGRPEVRPFSEHQIAVLQSFADQAVIAIENARLFNEVQAKSRDLEDSLQQQTATADVLKVISRSAFDLQAVLDTLVESAARLCEADSAALHRPRGDAYPFVASYGYTPEYIRYMHDHPLGLSRGSVLGRAVLEGKTVQVVDVNADTEYRNVEQRTRGDYRTVLGVPLMREGVPIGIIMLTRKTVRRFTDKQIELVTTFADQAVIAIENVRLFDEVQARTRDLQEALTSQTGSANILKVIASSPTDVGPVLKAIVESACELCEAYDAVLRLKDGDDLCVSAHYGPIPISRQRWRIGRSWTAGRSVLDRRAIQVSDMLSSEGDEFPEGREHGLLISARLQRRPRTILSVPLLREGESIGAITLRRTEVHPFSENQISLLRTFADQAVIAIGNVRLFDEVQARTRDLTESLEQQTATSEVLEVISASRGELELVFQKMLENATRVCGANFGTMSLYEAGSYQNVALYNIPDGSIEQLLAPIRPHPKSGLAIVARTLQAVQIEDLRTQAPYLEGHPAVVALSDRAGARTLVIVPMLRENELIGTIAIYRQEVRPFAQKQVELVANFAKQAVIAIENTRLLKELRQRTDDLTESLEQQTATSEVLQVISTSQGELEPVFRIMLENATRVCGANFGMMQLWNGETFSTTAAYNVPPAFAALREGKPIRVHHPQSGLSNVLKSHQVVHIHDITKGAAYLGGDPNVVELADIGGARTVVLVPMLKKDEFVGTFTIYRQEVRPFTDKQIALVENFTKQAVIAIENTRLLRELRERTDDLSTSLDELRTAQDRLVQTEKLASLGQLTAGIAHEIKNPLNFVNNFSALSAELADELNDVLKPVAMDDNVRGEVDELTGLLKDNLDKVVQHGKRADSIVKNMLLHSREGSGEHRPADINLLLDESLNLAYHGARAEKPGFNITLQRNFDPNAGAIELFPQEITRAFLNLITNSFYAATKRKTEHGESGFEPILRASTRNLGNAVEIRLRDNGTGIPSEVKEKIFNPFFTTKPAGEGTGLGLSMSHDIIVKQHGGTIYVDTEPGVFTEFVITLPRATSAQKPARSAY